MLLEVIYEVSPLVTKGFPSQRTSYVVLGSMSWRHRGKLVPNNFVWTNDVMFASNWFINIDIIETEVCTTKFGQCLIQKIVLARYDNFAEIYAKWLI